MATWVNKMIWMGDRRCPICGLHYSIEECCSLECTCPRCAFRDGHRRGSTWQAEENAKAKAKAKAKDSK